MPPADAEVQPSTQPCEEARRQMHLGHMDNLPNLKGCVPPPGSSDLAFTPPPHGSKRNNEENDKEQSKAAVLDAMLFDPNLKLSFGFLGSMDLTLSSLNAATASAIANKLCGTYHVGGSLRVYLADGHLAARCDFYGRAASSRQCDEEMKAVVAIMRDMVGKGASPAQVEAYATTHTSQKCKNEAETR